MAEIDERTEQGIALLSEMIGNEFGEKLRDNVRSGRFASDLTRIGMAHPYVDCWPREGLDRRSRSLLTIGALIGMKQPNELKNHIRIGLANGLTVKELEETIIHLATYVGYPAMASAASAITATLMEDGLLDENGITTAKA